MNSKTKALRDAEAKRILINHGLLVQDAFTHGFDAGYAHAVKMAEEILIEVFENYTCAHCLKQDLSYGKCLQYASCQALEAWKKETKE